ncbi:MAG: hypothetical protein QNJ90_15435 [Planctomycetota bacterium]|nr:hypothetical protein [Planctomycetota bacterium]
MAYDHTQRAPLYLLLIATAVLMLGVAWWVRNESATVALLVASAAILPVLFAFSFKHLRVRDEDDALGIRFGPIPVFGKRVPYASMREAHIARSSLIDGWGIHWAPGRGWTWNLWGRDCVEITTEKGLLRVGTDDPAGLQAWLEKRIAEESA